MCKNTKYHNILAFVEISQIHYTKSSGEEKEVVVGMSSTPGYVVVWSDYMHTDILLHVNHDLYTHFITCQPKSFLPILTMLHIYRRFCKNSLLSNDLIHGSTSIDLIVQVPLGPHVIQNRQRKQCRKPPNSHRESEEFFLAMEDMLLSLPPTTGSSLV